MVVVAGRHRNSGSAVTDESIVVQLPDHEYIRLSLTRERDEARAREQISAARLAQLEQLAELLQPIAHTNDTVLETVRRLLDMQSQLRERIDTWRRDAVADVDGGFVYEHCADEVECILNLL